MIEPCISLVLPVGLCKRLFLAGKGRDKNHKNRRFNVPNEKDMIEQAKTLQTEEQKKQWRDFWDTIPNRGYSPFPGLPHGENKEADNADTRN